jgi:hypothetical protein
VKNTGTPESHGLGVDVQFLQALYELDEAVAERVQAEGCAHCGGRLDRADDPRKPRGGALAPAAETWTRRLSLCCAREGCRRRATPPSVRFFGRRVYAEVVVILASVMALVTERASTLREATGVPVRTVRRWSTWWRTVFVTGALWRECCARMVPPPAEALLPASLLARFTQSTALLDVSRLLAPMTTRTVPDGSRFLRFGM